MISETDFWEEFPWKDRGNPDKEDPVKREARTRQKTREIQGGLRKQKKFGDLLRKGQNYMTKKELAELRRAEKLEKEKARVEALCEFEKKYAFCTNICGVDEVGRGPLAGPVMAGAVILPKDARILYINDSKKLTAKRREELYDVILREAVATGIGSVSPERIDEINILQAAYEAMREAVSKLSVVPDLLLVDAVHIPDISIRQVSIVKGDAKSQSIAAASIIAKVTRDRLMVEYDRLMPEYHFASNKGYGTREHIEALKKYGPCPIHRRTFITRYI
ncbi:MAG: ribonuclease HII [Bilifractor sp.]|jgi:ribonuclease HII